MVGALTYFVKRLISTMDKVDSAVERLNITITQQVTTCPLLHKEIDRRLLKLEDQLK